ncbi:hypothetical protein [Nonomuraea basaltis]|uniref:hypothetical protein n=1 Tax=Nonomuraea basaltis TaxID=2495887 RepID=UPI001487177A|nr:hypothetical protein [Nonomuraea basaltis]
MAYWDQVERLILDGGSVVRPGVSHGCGTGQALGRRPFRSGIVAHLVESSCVR